jgi:hypothetical protein
MSYYHTPCPSPNGTNLERLFIIRKPARMRWMPQLVVRSEARIMTTITPVTSTTPTPAAKTCKTRSGNCSRESWMMPIWRR